MKSNVVRRSRASTSQCGVVLLEVLVAILIFSFGILGTVGLLARATQFSTNAEDRNRAALLANEMSSAMWAAHSLTVDPTAWAARVADPTRFGLPNGLGTVTVDAPTATATIRISWRATNSTTDNQYVTQVVVP